MPKSRFNAVRERARATRHNPVGGRNRDATASGSQQVTLSTTPSTSKQEEDVIPILRSLPLDSTTTVNPSEVLWALTSLTSFLADKASRTQVLLPQHKLIPRVLFQLNSQNDYQIRDAASGCIRNLCIEAGGKTCKALEDQGCVEKCIEEIKVTAKKLALNGEKDQDEADQAERPREEESATQLLKKPKDSLNRKERRQLAKLEEVIAKRSGDANGDSVMNDGMVSSKDLEHLGLAETNGDDEQYLLCCSHLTNLISIVWCLVELSPRAAELCRRSAHTLSKIFTSTVANSKKSIKSMRESRHDDWENGKRIKIGKQDKNKKDKAMVTLAQIALNAMVTLTDSDPEFSAAVVGVSKEKLRHYQKTKKKTFVIDEEDTDGDFQKDGVENIKILLASFLTVDRLLVIEDVSVDMQALQRPAFSIAVLSVAVIRNIQSCLPDTLRNKLMMAGPEIDEEETSEWSRVGGKRLTSLGELEFGYTLEVLDRLLYLASTTEVEDVDNIFYTLEQEGGPHDASKAEEELNNLSLALEVYAELVGDRKRWSGQSGQSREKDDMITTDEDEEEDEDMNEGEEDGQSDVSVDLLGEKVDADIEKQEPDAGSFRRSGITEFFTERLDEAILSLSVQNQDGSPQLKQGDGSNKSDSVAASFRSVSIRALSALNNQCLVLASFAQSPPSQPQKSDHVMKSFHTWLTKSSCDRIWRWLFDYASLVAALPCLSQAEDDSSLSRDARKILELCLCIMWSLSRCYEGVDGEKSAKSLVIAPSDFEDDKFCRTAPKSIGVIGSLIAAYKTSKKISTPFSSIQESTTAVQLAPTPDGIRTHSLGVLSTLVRQSFVSMQDKEKIITLLVDVLDVLPTATDLKARLNSLDIRDSTSMDAMVVAVNGIIDTFANEESQWDALYDQLRLQSRLKRALLDVKSAARTIDKRKQPALRAAADEAWSNLVDFVQYREGLVK